MSVGVELWLEVGCEDSLVVKLNQSRLAAAVGKDRRAMMRGLRALEQAGLVRVVNSRPGRCVVVEVLKVSDTRTEV
jgi:hypothetical protein